MMDDKPRPEERPCGKSLGAFHAAHRYMLGGVIYQCPGGACHSDAPFIVEPESRPYEVRTVTGERYLAEADEVKHDVGWVTFRAGGVLMYGLGVIRHRDVTFRAGGVLTLSVRTTDVRTVRQVDPEEIEHAADEDDALAEARSWARHGYEIGQRHCGWSDHGVAPAWLTDGWPPHIEACEHAARAAEYDTALTRVRDLHRKANNGETCVYCAHGQRVGYDTTWPCDTIRALDGTEQGEATP